MCLFTGNVITSKMNAFCVFVLLLIIVVVKGQQRVAPGVPPQQYVGQVSCWLFKPASLRLGLIYLCFPWNLILSVLGFVTLVILRVEKLCSLNVLQVLTFSEYEEAFVFCDILQVGILHRECDSVWGREEKSFLLPRIYRSLFVP